MNIFTLLKWLILILILLRMAWLLYSQIRKGSFSSRQFWINMLVYATVAILWYMQFIKKAF